MNKYLKFTSTFFKDISFTIIGQCLVLVLAFLLNKYLSVTLGVVGYGEYSIARRAAGILGFVMLFGLGIAIPRYLAIYREKKDSEQEARCIISAISILWICSFFTIIVSLFFSKEIGKLLFGSIEYSKLVNPILLYAFSIAVTTFIYSYYRGIDNFYMFNATQVGLQVIVVLIALLVKPDIAYIFYFWSLVLGGYGFFSCCKIWFRFYPKAHIGNWASSLKNECYELVKFCLPRVPGEFILFAFSVFPLIFINNALGIEKSAYFAAGITVNTMITPLFDFVGIVLLPLVSKSLVNQEFAQTERKIRLLAILYFIIGVLGIAVMEFLMPFIIKLLFSIEFLTGEYVLKIMVLAILPNAFYLLLRNPLDAISKIPYNTINLFISFTILIILFSFSSNAEQFAFSYVISYLVLGVLALYFWIRCKQEVEQ